MMGVNVPPFLLWRGSFLVHHAKTFILKCVTCNQ
ncbi:unnamed protein product [Amoebophrya sp. A25]|nr:unnamed protein product [Amoebophrya sp. A25]|eukprot:GSA25T00021306001.1